MSQSPIGRMIDAAVRCLKCGVQGPPLTCDCWVLLKCPQCKRQKFTERQKTDPPHAKLIELRCPDCWTSDAV